MKQHLDSTWKRRGFSLLWDASALSGIILPSEVVSVREFFAMTRNWPEDLPGSNGDALVVAGVEGCLDALTENEGTIWLEKDLRNAMLRFQDEYEGQAALIVWLPSGRQRVTMSTAADEFFWQTLSSNNSAGIPIGRCLWAGAEADAACITITCNSSADVDSDACVGLYHPRIS